MKKILYLRKMLKEALSFYSFLLHSNRQWTFKSKKGTYPEGFNVRIHGKTAVTAEARKDALHWLNVYRAERGQRNV